MGAPEQLGDMHHAAVAMAELWEDRPAPHTPEQVASRLGWMVEGDPLSVTVDGLDLGAWGQRKLDTRRAETALAAAVEYGLIGVAAILR